MHFSGTIVVYIRIHTHGCRCRRLDMIVSRCRVASSFSPTMPGFFCTCYAWHSLFPFALWTAEMKAFEKEHPMVRTSFSPVVYDLSTGLACGMWGVFIAMSTRSQLLRDYEVFFQPLPMPDSASIMIAADIARVFLFLRPKWPYFYVGQFASLGFLFGFDLSGDTMKRLGAAVRGGGDVVVYAPQSGDVPHPEDHSTILRTAAAGGLRHAMSPRVAWYHSPLMSMDALVPYDYYELYFMRDYGTDRGPCVALYACTRSMSRTLGGFYAKHELYGVPHNDPARWFELSTSRCLGSIRMFEWIGMGHGKL